MRTFRLVFKLAFWGPILLTPLLGVWLASSWAAWANGPRWLVVLSGALLFPILPVLWELVAERRRRTRLARQREQGGFLGRMRAKQTHERMTTARTRVLLRTLFVNGVFLAVLLYGFPTQTLTAVAARGDWMLDDVRGPVAAFSRATLRNVADRLQAYNGEFNDNEFEDTEALPEVDVAEMVAATRKVATTTAITVELPPGAEAQLDEHVFTGSSTFTVPLLPTTVGVTFDDGRKLSCPLDPTVGTVVLVDGRLGGEPCEELVAPDPTWRPAIHLVEGWSGPEDVRLGRLVVRPDQVVRVQRNDPWLRIEVDDTAKPALCAATTDQRGWIAVVVAGKPRFLRVQREAHCDGFLPIDTENPFERGLDRTGDADAGSGLSGWPFRNEPDPRVLQVPADRLASIKALGAWIQQNANTELERARLVHDWVAVNVQYDVESLQPGKRAPQDADTVFRRRTGVCAGYANLVRALGRAAGLEVVYLTGNSRDTDSSGHAWNAIKVDGAWLLVDATWDSGFIGDSGFESRYRSTYLFTPPALFRQDHLPTNATWQLSPNPISRGEFLRQNRMTVEAAAQGIVLVSPTTPQVQATGKVELQLENPGGLRFIARIGEQSCTVDQGSQVRVECPVPPQGTHEVSLYAKPGADAGSYPRVGALTVQAG